MLSQLNPKQREAVEQTEGPVLILAGAGSGKTRVLTYRMAHLIRNLGVPPWSIFAVTFTNKAAGEMKDRVEKLMGGSARDMTVSTFHSACLRILRRNAAELGYKSDFSIYDDKDQFNLLTQCFEELKLSTQTINPKAVAHKINEAKHEGVPPESFAQKNTDFFGERVAAVYTHYQKKLRTNQAMDFGDLILNALLLFKTRPHVLEYYQSLYRYLHVDEYQDTNRSQYELISLLASKHRNLCVVGDDDQSIYKFRGAEIKNILDFQKDYSDAAVIRLEQNYRSTQTILTAAGAVVSKNRGRMGKTLWTENGEGEKITMVKGGTEYDEARYVVEKIRECHDRNSVRYADIAIFYRTNAQSRAFEDELRKNRIPYVIIGGMKFYDRQEIKDAMAYLKLLLNPADSVSLKRVINVPGRGIGKTTIERLDALAAEAGVSLWEILVRLTGRDLSHPVANPFNGGTTAKLASFVTLLSDLNEARKTTTLTDFMPILFDKTGYWQMLVNEKTIESQGRIENLEEFVNVVEEFEKTNPENALEAFLDQASLMSDLDKMDKEADRLPLMTLHLCKGLEFPHVFMVGMEEGLFPHSRSLDNEADLEEERRLCYVGMTRAREKLTLSFVQRRRIFGSDQFHIPSRFLEEVPENLVDTDSAGATISAQPYGDEHTQWEEPASFETRQGQTNQVSRYSQKKEYVDYSYDQRSTPMSRPAVRGVRPPVRPAAVRTAPIETSTSKIYPKGGRIKHPIFGVGIVRACEGKTGDEKLTVVFEGGETKKILAKYANLTVL